MKRACSILGRLEEIAPVDDPCPRCNDRIPEEFYCRTCGYLPDWRQMASEKYEAHREAA